MPEWCRREEKEGWKDGGRAVIDTDRGESVLVYEAGGGDNNSRGTGTTTLALWLAGRH